MLQIFYKIYTQNLYISVEIIVYQENIILFYEKKIVFILREGVYCITYSLIHSRITYSLIHSPSEEQSLGQCWSTISS